MTRIVQHYLDRGVFLKKLEKRQVRLPVCILQNVIKVSYGLMIMNGEDEMELWITCQRENLLI